MIVHRLKTVPPNAYPVDIAGDLREHCRATADHDGDLARILAAATDAFEAQSGLALIEQTWQLHLDEIPSQLYVKPAPFISVEQIEYFDTDDNLSTLDPSKYRATPAIQLIEFIGGMPELSDRVAPVVVTVKSGFGTSPDDIPDRIKHAIRVQSAQYFLNRESTTEANVKKAAFAYEHLLHSAVEDYL